MDDRDQRIEEARASHARGDWTAARDGFRAVGDLDVEDLDALADACWWLGLVDESIELVEQRYQRLADAGQEARAADAAMEIAFHQFLRGQAAIGSGWLARARRLLADLPPSREHGLLYLTDAGGALDAGDLQAAADLLADVTAIAEEEGDTTLRALARFGEGQVAIRRGRIHEGTALLDEAMLPVVAGELPPAWAGNLYCQMMAVCHELADLQRAREWTEATEEWCRGFERAVMFVGICRVHRVQLLQAQGDWDRAEDEVGEACGELAHMNTAIVAEAHYERGELHRLRDRQDAAEEAYRAAHDLGRDPQPGLALLRLRQGRTEVAAASLETARIAATDRPLATAPLLAAEAEVALARGDLASADRAVEQLERIAEASASPGWHAAAAQWRGTVLVARDRPADALPVLHDAARRWRDLQVPYETARVRVEIARADEALGDHDGASRELDAAGATFTRLRARWAARQVDARRGGQRGPGELTRRELEVVDAVASGRTNREVAAELHISERTVARHLANVYLKTGVSTRTAAVTWARERGLL